MPDLGRRIGRNDFWLCVLAAVCVSWLVSVAAWRLGVARPSARIISEVVLLVALIVPCILRGNDRGHTPVDTLILLNMIAVGAALISLGPSLGIGKPVLAGFSAFVLVLTLIAIVDLGLMDTRPHDRRQDVASGDISGQPAV